MDDVAPSFEDTQPEQAENTNRAPASGPPSFEDTQAAPVAQAQSAPPSFDQTDPVEKYETAGQQALAGVEGVGKGLAGPLFTGAETYLFNNAKEQKQREAVNPATHIVCEGLGLVGPALATLGTSAAASAGIFGAESALPVIQAASKFTQAGVLEQIARAGSSVLGLGGEGSGVISKIGSAAVKGMIENAGFQTSDEISKQILDPNLSQQAVSSAIYNVGGAALFGGVAGSAFETIPALWKARYEGTVGGVLKSIVNKVGGIEGVVPDPVNDIINYLGIDVPPEIRASMSNDPEIRQYASTLNQSDTTRSGLEYQGAVKNFRTRLDEIMVESLGKDPATISKDFSEAQQGNKIGTILSQEYGEKMGPVSDAFENARTKYADADLGATLEEKNKDAAALQAQLQSKLDETNAAHFEALSNGDFDTAAQHEQIANTIKQNLNGIESGRTIPGVKDVLSQDILNLVSREGWAGSDDIMKEVNRLTKRIPYLQTIGDLQKEMTTVGNNTASKLPFGMQDPVSRAGGMIKSVMREAEFSAVGREIGSEEGIDALNSFNENRKNFSALAKQKDALDDRLKIGGSATNYANGIQGMATTDGEQVLRRLSGRGDANILKVLQEHFPRTARAVKDAHIDRIISDAAKSAGQGNIINSTRLLKNISNMSPEVRNFAIPQSAQAGLSLSNALSEKISDFGHNWSNTARTADKLLQHVPGAAAGLATMLLSKNPLIGVLVGGLTKPVARDAPDAIRLAVLKFLGSSQPVEPSAFKSAMEFIASTIKGENLAVNSVKNVFKGAGEVFSSAIMPQSVKESRDILDDKVKQIQQIPGQIMKTGEKTSYYMPEHGQAIAQSAAAVSGYLNQIRPKKQKNGILDTETDPSWVDQSEYNRALDIANQPLSVLPKIKSGTILPQDVEHLKNMYPSAHQDLSKRLITEMTDHLSSGGSVPYETRQGLSVFLSQAMDSSMSPQAIQSIQSLYAQAQPAVTSSGRKNTGKMGKISQDHYTGEQAAAKRQTAWD